MRRMSTSAERRPAGQGDTPDSGTAPGVRRSAGRSSASGPSVGASAAASPALPAGSSSRTSDAAGPGRRALPDRPSPASAWDSAAGALRPPGAAPAAQRPSTPTTEPAAPAIRPAGRTLDTAAVPSKPAILPTQQPSRLACSQVSHLCPVSEPTSGGAPGVTGTEVIVPPMTGLTTRRKRPRKGDCNARRGLGSNLQGGPSVIETIPPRPGGLGIWEDAKVAVCLQRCARMTAHNLLQTRRLCITLTRLISACHYFTSFVRRW
jgi:hypothetical protein